MEDLQSIQKSAKTAGIAYVLIIGTSILAMLLGPYKLIVEGDTEATIQNIASGQSLYRIGATYDLLMFIGVIILSVALYKVLKKVNGTVALTALFSRIGEALIGSLSVICSVLILWLINRENSDESNLKTIEFLFEAKAVIMNIVFAFLGLGSILYCYLFYRSRFIPRLLAAFGIFSFILVFAESIIVLLFPVKSLVLTGIPAILFEIAVGIWLWSRGINVKYWEEQGLKTV